MRSTPKVFNASFKPPKTYNWSGLRQWLPVLWIALFFIGLTLIARLPVFRISNIIVEGTGEKDIIATIEELSGQSIFSRNVSRLQERLPAQYYSIAQATCRRGIPSTLRCEVTLRQPGMIWKTADEQFLVDNQGVVYSKVISTIGADQRVLMTVEDGRGLKVELGDKIATSEILTSMNEALTAFNTQGYTTGSVLIDDAYYQFRVNLISRSDGGPFPTFSPLPVLMTSSYPITSQVNATVEILKTKSSAITQYLDLRVPGYAYFK